MQERKKPIEPSTILSNNNLKISIFLFLLSFFMPKLVNVTNLGLYESLYLSVENSDQGLLIITSFKLVLMNAIRILPIYMASFSVIEIMKEVYDRKVPFIQILMAIMIVPLQYFLLAQFIGVRYFFGYTPVFIMITILLFVRLDLSKISVWRKSFFVIFLLIGLQWVDIMPMLSPYGFGQGEVSFDLKQAANFMGADEALNFSALMFFSFFIINAFVILAFLRDQNRSIKAIEAQSQMEIELREMKMQSLRARSLEEMQNLVHDLKSPLTSVQALVSLSEMLVEDDKVTGYMKKISKSVDQLNIMISEILHEDKRNLVDVDDLFQGILSQMSPIIRTEEIIYNNDFVDGKLEINKTRFSRMIVNILNNSLSALDKEKGIIRIDVFEKNGSVIIEIEDNGKGILPEDLKKIRERGFSTKGSSGIGLQYVEDVVQNHGGVLEINSTVSEGTLVRLSFIRDVRDEDEEDINY